MVTCKAAAKVATARRTPNARILERSSPLYPHKYSLVNLSFWRLSLACSAPQSHGIALNRKVINRSDPAMTANQTGVTCVGLHEAPSPNTPVIRVIEPLKSEERA